MIIFEEWLKRATPGALRETAATFRKLGDTDAAYDLELLADVRERGGVDRDDSLKS
jgi:hypothetical protein